MMLRECSADADFEKCFSAAEHFDDGACLRRLSSDDED